MKFEIIQTLQTISDLYQLKKTRERFDQYLQLLQGDKDELLLPIAGFNPMGNKLAASKLEQLIKLKAETIAQEEISKINTTLGLKDNRIIQVGLNLVDDLEGAWSNYYTTDYTSKFEIESLVKRNFCTPYFWTSENITKEIIRERVRSSVYRTIFWTTNKTPKTLQDFLEQEIYIQANALENPSTFNGSDFAEIEEIYKEHFKTIDYNVKFNFFYGDKASELLN